MKPSTYILISAIKAGGSIADKLISENRDELIEHLCKNYDAEIAELLQKQLN